MAFSKLFDIDPFSGGITTFEGNGDGTGVLITATDLAPVLERNKALYNHDHDKKAFFWHVGDIPNAIIEKWRTEDGIDVYNEDHWPAVKRKLNSSEWRYLRTMPGRI